jgi:hypothetical protein
MHRDGRLGDDELLTTTRAFAVGDRVIARRNDRRADLLNGMRGDVVGVDSESRSVLLRTGDGTTRQIESSYLDDGWLDHAYALTAHAAQGATVDQSFVLGSDELYREWGYTALSRHREHARFYVVSPSSVERALPGLEPDRDVVAEDVAAILSPSRRKELALDVLDRSGPTAAERAVRAAQEDMERAEQRIATMREERAALGRLQRSRRAAIDQDIARQEEAIERWSLQAEAIVAPPYERAPSSTGVPHTPPDLDDTRSAVLDPEAGVRRTVGSRPSSFRAREARTREAIALVGPGKPSLDSARAPASMDDVGLEL